jgi:type I restriction enzyme S subunit
VNHCRWATIPVKNFVDSGEAETKTGPFGTQLKASDYVEYGTPVINVRNIGFGTIRPDKLEYLAPDTVKRLSSHLLQTGDIVFGRKGAVERHVLIRPGQNSWFQGSDCLRLRFNSKSIDPRFVSYFLLTDEHKQWIINQCSHGATMASLNQEIIWRINLNIPPLPTQRKIAGVLSAYDDLIENNSRRIAILEEMAQAIYREWFVNFRFPGHENVKLIDSPLGKIPEGWRVTTLGDAIDLAYGKALKADDRKPGNFPVYGSGGIVGVHNEFYVKGPGIIVGRKGNVGTVFWSDEDFYPIDTVFFVKTKLPLHYVYYNLLISQSFLNSDAAVPGLNRNQACLNPFIFPSQAVMHFFQSHCVAILSALRSLRARKINLQTTRDLLLPKLISGQLDVEDLDIEIGEQPVEATT